MVAKDRRPMAGGEKKCEEYHHDCGSAESRIALNNAFLLSPISGRAQLVLHVQSLGADY
jgi:hypothetical protein